MLFGQDRNELRRFYFQAWKKFCAKQPLEPLEEIVAGVIKMHPEYHELLADEDKGLGRDYHPELDETNPFLHMGMHIALHEQVATDRPAGIRLIAKQLLLRVQDVHAAEHQMMECLAEMIWQAQRANSLPDELAYLRCLRGLVKP
ncbi:MAG: DUF1841 family protein [Pseudomonadota bacterium]